MLRGAIIGLGNVALAGHLPGWLRCRDVEIVAATDVEPARRTAIEALVPTVTWYDTAESLLARERLDFVDICTPPASHGPLVTAALGSSRHVLCEKPLVIAPEELAPLTAVAGPRGVPARAGAARLRGHLPAARQPRPAGDGRPRLESARALREAARHRARRAGAADDAGRRAQARAPHRSQLAPRACARRP